MSVEACLVRMVAPVMMRSMNTTAHVLMDTTEQIVKTVGICILI